MGRWTLEISLRDGDQRALPIQLATAIAEAIRAGRLAAGDTLPGSRALAATLGLSRNTVLAAYQELHAQGWIESHGARGTRIRELVRLEPEPGRADRGTAGRPAHRSAAAGSTMGFDLPDDAIDWAVPFTPPHGGIRWDHGVPDTRLFPAEALSRALRRVLRRRRQVLDYRVPERLAGGASRLGVALADMLGARRGLIVSPADIVVTRGSQMALFLTLRALIRPGEHVAIEEPGYGGAWPLLALVGAHVHPVSVDEQGIDVAALRTLSQRVPLRTVLVTPHHQFPTTVGMSQGRRDRLLGLAREQRFAIIEDDYDHEFHYEGRPLTPLASQDPGAVVYLSSLSKLCAPGLRLGYVAAPRPLIERIERLRFCVAFEVDGLLEEAVAELFEDGELQRHLHRARQLYQRRRDHLVAALRSEIGSALDFEVPGGGLAIWARVDDSIDVEAWARRALDHGLSFRTGRAFYSTPHPEPRIRLGFAMLDEGEQREAVRRLAASLAAVRKSGGE